MGFRDLLLPDRCSGCGLIGPSPCRDCVERLRVLDEIRIGPAVERCLVLLDYDDLSRRLIARLKYGAVLASVEWFARAMAERVELSGEHIDVATWVPSVPRNRRRRGFDQGEMLARPLAAALGIDARRLLIRRGSVAQTGRRRHERVLGPVIHATPGLDLSGSAVLLVDDVVTTGSTLTSAADTLKQSGAGRVVAVVAAHSRLGRGPHRPDR